MFFWCSNSTDFLAQDKKKTLKVITLPQKTKHIMKIFLKCALKTEKILVSRGSENYVPITSFDGDRHNGFVVEVLGKRWMTVFNLKS